MQKIETRTGAAIIIGFSLLTLGLIFTFWSGLDDFGGTENFIKKNKGGKNIVSSQKSFGLVKFSSESELKEYMEASEKMNMARGFGGAESLSDFSMPQSAPLMEGGAARTSGFSEMAKSSNAVDSGISPNRFSQTNTQVLSIDEPDIVKTDGQNIYYSKERRFMLYDERPMPMSKMAPEIGIVPPYPDQPNYADMTEIIKAFPLAEAKKIGRIDERGDLFISNKTLIILAQEKKKIYAYDVSSPGQPKEKWNWSLAENSRIVTSRMMNGKIFLISESYSDLEKPCPIRPMTRSGVAIELACTDIYHPIENVSADSTYSLVTLDAETGNDLAKTAFVGSGSTSTVYVSEQSVYLTYQKPTDNVKLFATFLESNSDLFSPTIAQKIKNLDSYDISSNAKLEEMNTLIQKHLQSLSRDESMKLRNNVSNRLTDFAKKEGRRYQSTGIVKIGVSNLEPESTGEVPGTPLNQFSLDEYKGNLRIATTFTPLNWLPGGFYSNNNSEQASDVYVLNENLNPIGSVKDLGKGERIYSVRFLKDRGYVVTFKQIDPFFVLDLSSPDNPELKGELKIPGYSSYLHPLPNGQILGVGEEDGKVKISSFEVSDPSNPKEVSTYRMDEYWSEAGSNHHAFLLDEKHRVFFIPGSEGGYIFSYEGGIKLERAISGFQVKRAVYIDNYMYIIGEKGIKVINENSWSDEKEIEL